MNKQEFSELFKEKVPGIFNAELEVIVETYAQGCLSRLGKPYNSYRLEEEGVVYYVSFVSILYNFTSKNKKHVQPWSIIAEELLNDKNVQIFNMDLPIGRSKPKFSKK